MDNDTIAANGGEPDSAAHVEAAPPVVEETPVETVVEEPAADLAQTPATMTFAVLTAPRGPLLAGQLVRAAPAAIADLVNAGAARAATPREVELANPLYFPIPPAAPSADTDAAI